MNCGISTACFYPATLEEAVRQLTDHGVPYTELFVNTFCEARQPMINWLAETLRQAGTKVVSVHPFTCTFETLLFFTPYEQRFLDGLEFYKQTYFDLMHSVGADILVIHGCNQSSKYPEEQCFERYAQLREMGLREGIHIAQENAAMFKSGSLDFLRKMKTYLHGNVDFVLDIKQAVRREESPIEMAQVLGENIIHTHVSDHRPGADCLPIGEGEFDFGEYFSVLKACGFKGSAMLELYRDNYREYSQLFDSLKRLNQWK